MKKLISLFSIIVLIMSVTALVGCNGLWGFDDDDDVVQPSGIKFNIKGVVDLPGDNVGSDKTLRANVASLTDELFAVVYKLKADGSEEAVDSGKEFPVSSTDGTYECGFTNTAAYYFVKIKSKKATLPNFVLTVLLGTLNQSSATQTSATVNAESTAVYLVVKKAIENNAGLLEPTVIDKTSADFTKIKTDVSNNSGDLTNVAVAVAATKVTISNGTSINLTENQKVTLTATIEPSYSTDKVAWTVVSGGDFITFNTVSGEVTGKAEGQAVVRATAGAKTADITINVAKQIFPVTSVVITGKVSELEKGQIVNLSVAVEPSNATDRTVTWSVSPTTAAVVVTKTGDFTATLEAKEITTAVTVTATANGKSDSFAVSVKAATIKPVTVSLGQTYATKNNELWVYVEGFGSADLTALTSTITDGTKTFTLQKDKSSTSTRHVLGVVLSGAEIISFNVSSIVLTGATIPSGSVIKVFTEDVDLNPKVTYTVP